MNTKVWNANELDCITEIPAFIQKNYIKDSVILIEIGKGKRNDISHDELGKVVRNLLEKDLKLVDGEDFHMSNIEVEQHLVSVMPPSDEGKSSNLLGLLRNWLETKLNRNPTKDSFNLSETQKEIDSILVIKLIKRLDDLFQHTYGSPTFVLTSIQIKSGKKFKAYLSRIVELNNSSEIGSYYCSALRAGIANIAYAHIDRELSANIEIDDSDELEAIFSLTPTSPADLINRPASSTSGSQTTFVPPPSSVPVTTNVILEPPRPPQNSGSATPSQHHQENTRKFAYNVDIVFCIDGTGSMNHVIDGVKSFTSGMHTHISEQLLRAKKRVDSLRVKIIVFRHFENDGDLALQVMDFKKLPEQENEVCAFVNSISPMGGVIDEPENSLEALAMSIKSDWSRGGNKRRHIILLFTDENYSPLGITNRPDLTQGLPKNNNELVNLWNAETNIDQIGKRLFLFVPMTPVEWRKQWEELIQLGMDNVQGKSISDVIDNPEKTKEEISNLIVKSI